MSENIINASYIGKTPLLRQLNNVSGQFYLFQQYSNDLTNFLGNTSGNMPIPKTFYCLNLNLPNSQAHDNDNLIPENQEEINSSNESLMTIDEILEAQNGVFCKELMYKGDINIFGTDSTDSVTYNEIYCHVDNDAQRQKFRLNLQNNYDCIYNENYVIGYGPDTIPNNYEFSDYGTYIGDILQNEYENGNTFFNINFKNEATSENSWDNNYYLGRLIYVLYKNGLITFSEDESIYDDEPDINDYHETNNQQEPLEQSNENSIIPNNYTSNDSTKAGVLSNKALFDDIIVESDIKNGIYRFFKTNSMEITPLEKIKFQFNAILVCYGFKNNTNGDWENNTEIPMGLYFTGFDKDPNDETDLGDFVNAFTKYYKNNEIYNQGTSYTLRLCTRTLSSQATDTSEVVTNIISASNTGEWVNEYEMLMSKFDETYNTMQSVKNKYSSMYNILQENLDRFRNNRTNVPYIRQVGKKKFWFVNGVNTLQEVIEQSDMADWENPEDQVLPTFQSVFIDTSSSDNIFISSGRSVYIGTNIEFNINMPENNEYPYFTLTYDNNVLNYDCAELLNNTNDYYDNENYIHIVKDIDDDRIYKFIITNVLYGCYLNVRLSTSNII